ncbi:MAG: hypothetical protein JXA82_18890 [Sedimentisphaerales bacterium]|nr:hypothetical protein [Sedimentisphaerales bacterium]
MTVKDNIIIVLCVVVGLGLLLGGSLMLPGIHQAREDMGLVVNASLENAPPSLAFATVAMGAFRGLVVDVLWIRADRLKEEGLFFDAKQLAEWITVLQPRFSTVWVFHAWNMAYNISVAVPAEQWEERWRWVRNGLELLRDRGIPMNPQSIILYRELAWIFQHKMGALSDDCHRYYKRELALEMRRLLGQPETNEYFEQLSNAPQEWDRLLTNETVAAFVEELKNADSVFTGVEPMEFAKKYLGLREQPKKYKPAAFSVIDKYRDTPTLEQFDLFAKSYVLRREWKYDISFMQEMNHTYGRVNIEDPNDRMPLNWEHPDTHAIYWASLGLKVAGKPETYSIDEKNTDRIVFHSLQSLYRTGDMVIYPTGQGQETVLTLPDLAMFDSCNQAWERSIDKYVNLEKGNPKAVRGGHRNFLENAVHSFYRAGYRRKAARIYTQLRREYGADTEDIRFKADYQKPLIEWVRDRILHEQESSIGPKDATEQIIFSLRLGYYYYSLRKDSQAQGYEQWAEEIYKAYQARSGEVEQGRMGLPSFGFLKYQSFRQFMEDPFYPVALKQSLIGRIQVERPELFKQLQEQEAEWLKQVEESAQTGAFAPNP